MRLRSSRETVRACTFALSMGSCALGAAAAVAFWLRWLDLVGLTSGLAPNLAIFLALSLAPIGAYAAGAFAGRRHAATAAVSALASAAAAAAWSLAALTEVGPPDPELELGVLGSLVAAPHAVAGLVLGYCLVASRVSRPPRCARERSADDGGEDCRMRSSCPIPNHVTDEV